MATEVVMPKLGLTMETGTIGAWLVAEGAAVAKGQPLLEIITDKVTMEVEAQADGHLLRILHGEGEEVAVSQLIGLIGTPGEDLGRYDAPTALEERAEAQVAAVEPVAQPVGQPAAMASQTQDSVGERTPHRVSPKARKIAAERGLDVQRLVGTGAGGRVVSADVERAEAGTAERSVARPVVGGPTPVSGQHRPLMPAERIAAERLTESYQQTPHIHVSMDVSAIWLDQFRQGYRLEGKSISYNDLIVQATARALRDVPRVNSHYSEGGFVPMDEVNVGIAVAAEKGLVVPVLRNADAKSIDEIASESVRLVDRARRGELTLDDMVGGTFTISNLGMFGVSRFTAIINPPQVAILAVGAIEKRVVALDGDAFAVRPQMTLTLAADHRVVDGALAARFLARLREIIQTPGLLG